MTEFPIVEKEKILRRKKRIRMKTSFMLTVNSDVVMIIVGLRGMDSMEIESLIFSSSLQM